MFNIILSIVYLTGSFKITGTIIAGIVIGIVVGIAILCCLVGTVVDCFVHIYKYWCSCLHKAYHYQTEMTTFRSSSPRVSPSEPTNLMVRALPPSYSAVMITSETPHRHTEHDPLTVIDDGVCDSWIRTPHHNHNHHNHYHQLQQQQRDRRRDLIFEQGELFGVARELKVHSSNSLHSNVSAIRKVLSPRGMPPSYSSLYLRSGDCDGDDGRVILNTSHERTGLLTSYTMEENDEDDCERSSFIRSERYCGYRHTRPHYHSRDPSQL